MSILLSYSEDI